MHSRGNPALRVFACYTCTAVTTYYQSAQFDGSENSPIVIADSAVKKTTHPEEKNTYNFIPL